MPSSTVSLGSLSSPSPSPPPQEHHTISSNSNHSGPAAFDSGSDLSDLTEDEQDNDNRENDSRDNDSDDGRSSSNSRKKRGGIVPAPMWDWAYKNNKKGSDWRSKLIAEEEEEEQSGPAKAMEEEEDEDQDSIPPPGVDATPDDTRPPSATEPPASGHDEGDIPDDHFEEEVLQHTSPITALDEPASGDEEDDDQEEGETTATTLTTRHLLPALSDDENDEDDEGEEAEDDDGPDQSALPVDGPETDDEAEPMVSEGVETKPTATPTEVGDSVGPAELAPEAGDEDADGEATNLMEVDATAPSPSSLAPIAAAAAASSIMAGSSVIDPPSPSTSSSRSGSPSSSRSPTPEVEPEAEAASDHEGPEEPAPVRKTNGRRSANRSRKAKARTRTSRKKAGSRADREIDADADADAVPTAEADEGDAVDAEDGDGDGADMELDSDLQPAHRAEALDVLATIELKFALLRERLYVEKMEGLAWEEGLIAEGTHPELLHLHAELSKRRDKRLELASRRRDYEIANVTKRRKLDEDGLWSWWKHERDELQTDMISDTNRKKRKLERERRAMERPLPARRIPNPPLEIDIPPTLREIVRSYPFNAPNSRSRHRGKDSSANLVYPQLSTLSNADIASDMEFLYQHRRAAAGYDPHRSGVIGMNSMLGPVPHGFDAYNAGMSMMDGMATPNRFGPPPPAFQHGLPHPQMQGPSMIQGYPNHGPRPLHHHPSTMAMSGISHPQMGLEQDMGPLHRPPSDPAQIPPHMQQYGMQPGANLMRRSISPVSVQGLNGPGAGMSTGVGAPPLPPGFGGPKANGWVSVGNAGPSSFPGSSKDIKRHFSEFDARERDKERERYNEGMKGREDTERDRDVDIYHVQVMHQPQQRSQQLHLHPQTSHPHVGTHHPHHHHHHVHHHHHPQGPGGVLNNGSPPGPGHFTLPGATLSPRSARDFEPRRPGSGAPTEIIELSASSTKAQATSPPMSIYWKGTDDSSVDPSRRQKLGPPGPHERFGHPFGPPVPQSNYTEPPRSGLMPSTAPASAAPSRRGSWSAQEDSAHPRPSSSASFGPSGSGPLQNSSSSGSHRRIPHSSSSQSHHSAFGSPPLSNGRPVPLPTSPSGPPRSPKRSSLAVLPTPQLPPPPMTVPHSPPTRPLSPPKTASPTMKAFQQNPTSPKNSKAPMPPRNGVDQSFSTAPPTVASSVSLNALSLRTASPLSLYPSASPHAAPPPSRLQNGGMSESQPVHIGGGPAPKVVPVDGSS